MLWFILCSLLLWSQCTKQEPCNSTIWLKARPGHITHARWVNASTVLTCPAGLHNSSIWSSSRSIYKMTIGCANEEESSLQLNWFPDVPNITARFLSHVTNMETQCIFSSNEGVLKAQLLPEFPINGHPNELIATIYYDPKEILTHEFFICKQGKVRNGTCRTQYNNGTYDRGKQRIHTSTDFYKITDELNATNLAKHECFANIDGTYHLISVKFKQDMNECSEAEAMGTQLCATGTCIDRWTGYTCSTGDLVNLHMCRDLPDWFCPNNATYDYMSEEDCGKDKCLEAANLGLQLCDAGVEACENTNMTYRCRRGVPLLDACNSVGEAIDLRCPRITKDTPGLAEFGSTLQRIAYNAQALRDFDPHYFSSLAKGLNDEQMKKEISSHTEHERKQMAQRLLDTLISTVDVTYQSIKPVIATPATPISTYVPSSVDENDVGIPQSPPGVKSPQVNEPSTPEPPPKPMLTMDKVRTASTLLHMVATIARSTMAVKEIFDKGQADRNGVKFWRLPPGKNAAQIASTDEGNASLEIVEDATSDRDDQIVAVLPFSKLTGTTSYEEDVISLDETVGRENAEERQVVLQPALVQSDVLLIDTTSLSSTYHVFMNLTKKPENSVTCHQLQHTANETQWSDDYCKTIVVGLQYECQCRPREKGTFAIALVYWIGSAEIPTEHEHVITLVNYIFTSITIVALLLFLIFTRFVGVFRLDQFNIAFCLMLSAIVSLIIPFVTDKQPIPCVILAIAVCFFPLAAFSWKFIFGLNTLILIVAPQSRYHDIVSRHRHCIPLVWIGYIVPAVIVGAWFGYAEKVQTQKFCIGPQELRWLFIGPITAVVIFNFIVLLVVGIVLLRSYLLTRKSRLNKSTHLLVLTQLMLTLGIPYIAIYIQFLDPYTMLIVVPVAMALTAVLMFLLVAVIDEENRQLLRSFIRVHFTRSTTLPPSFPQSQGSQIRGKMTPHGHGGLTDNTFAPQANKPFTPGKRNRGKWFTSARGSGKTESDPQTMERLRISGPGGNGWGKGQVYSETANTELTFEPGWLHRYPATTTLHNGRTTPIEADAGDARSSSVQNAALPSSVMQANRSILNVPKQNKDNSRNGSTARC